MSDDTPPEREQIFREKAHRLYLQNQQKIVVLKLARPSLVPWFWATLCGLGVLVFLVWTARVPTTLGGSGLVAAADDEVPILVALLPPGDLEQLGADQRILVYDDTGSANPILVARIDRVEPTVWSPQAVRRRFDDHATVEGPVAVATARIATRDEADAVRRFAGGRLRVEVEVGTRRVLGLFPVVGERF